MNTVKWRRHDGSILEVNDKPATTAECERLGYERVSNGGIVLPRNAQAELKRMAK